MVILSRWKGHSNLKYLLGILTDTLQVEVMSAKDNVSSFHSIVFKMGKTTNIYYHWIIIQTV